MILNLEVIFLLVSQESRYDYYNPASNLSPSADFH